MSIFNKDYEGGAGEGGTGGDTLIAQGVRVEGEFVSSGNVVVEGEVHGSLSTAEHLMVGIHAKIVANVKAATALVAGTIEGNIRVDGRLELKSTSRMIGDIMADDLVIESGAVLNGKIAMKQTEEASAFSASKKNRKTTKDEVVVGEAAIGAE